MCYQKYVVIHIIILSNRITATIVLVYVCYVAIYKFRFLLVDKRYVLKLKNNKLNKCFF